MAHKIQAFTPTESSRDGGIDSPSVNPLAALARFEFEPGRSNDGTKILMVEWEEDDVVRRSPGEWRVSWAGKSTVLPADERTDEHTRRVYFLLPPGTTIPPSITLSHTAASTVASLSRQPLSMQINPLPAIFPPSLGATARTAGKKGVLHTIWAKKRLQVLRKEIEAESSTNVESVGLDMALQEKEWIEENFGIAQKPVGMGISIPGLDASTTGPPISPMTPRSPGGGRLSEKLKGLRLGTTDQELINSNDGKRLARYAGRRITHAGMLFLAKDNEAHPLSPETQDVAVSSFAAFHQSPVKSTNRQTRTAAQIPPSHVRAQQQDYGNLSMDSIAMKKPNRTERRKSSSRPGAQQQAVRTSESDPRARKRSQDSEDELFAKALSPRSPDIPRSPFSFSTEDTLPFRNKRAEK
ncbi:hypothetical protein MMC16_005637 [Acarospora aff. strigata]|nr:hypothetical protein [Acarospora aff. strigata]